ncbi:MAG: IPT/TIG domain-containing protein [Ilumatobacteraceae bacterium]
MNQLDPTVLAIIVSIDAGAPLGLRDVTLTNPDGGFVTKTGAFTVSAIPTATSVSKSVLRQGLTTSVQINGSGFAANFVTGGGTVSFGPGVTVSSVVRNSATRLTASVAVAASATPGPRTVSITNPDQGAAACVDCLTIVANPAIAGVDPASQGQGARRSITITGTGFVPGAIVKIVGGGVTVNSTTVADPTSATLDVSVANAATVGSRDVVITNPDTGTATCAACFDVTARPTIGTLSPATLARGVSDATVEVSGSGFSSDAVVTFSGQGVTATILSATPTTLTLLVSVAAAAPTGLRALTIVHADGGTATKAGVLRIT